MITFILHFDASRIADPTIAQSKLTDLHAYCKANQIDLLIRDTFYHDASWRWTDQSLKLAHDLLWNDDFKTYKTEHIDAAIILDLWTDAEACVKTLNEFPEAVFHTFAAVTGHEALIIRRNDEAKAMVEKLLSEVVA